MVLYTPEPTQAIEPPRAATGTNNIFYFLNNSSPDVAPHLIVLGTI